MTQTAVCIWTALLSRMGSIDVLELACGFCSQCSFVTEHPSSPLPEKVSQPANIFLMKQAENDLFNKCDLYCVFHFDSYTLPIS